MIHNEINPAMNFTTERSDAVIIAPFYNSTAGFLFMKKCTQCKELKPLNEFHKSKGSNDGLSYYCKSCKQKKLQLYRKTEVGMIGRIYSSQKAQSVKRNHPLPLYTIAQLRIWALGQSIFSKLFNGWVLSNYDIMLKPSFDRKDDYKPYTLDNLQIMTWDENNKKADSDRRNGINNKDSKAVIQLTKEGKFIKEYYSMSQAGRETGIGEGSISSVCRNKTKTGGGFIWKYA